MIPDDKKLVENIKATMAIEGLYFAGIHLEPATAAEQERETLPDNKYPYRSCGHCP